MHDQKKADANVSAFAVYEACHSAKAEDFPA